LTAVRVFLAGATGVIGRELVPLLLAAGHDLTAMTRSPHKAGALEAQGATACVCDALDAQAVESAVLAAKPDAVIHELTDIPAVVKPRKFASAFAPTNRLRIEGTRNLVAAARAAGTETLIAQSIAFMYDASGSWIKEEAAPLYQHPAPALKAIVHAVAELERQVLDFGGIVLRYGYFYGPGTGFAGDGSYAKLARTRQLPVLGAGEGRWSFIHVSDGAEATVAALARGKPGIYNIVDDEPAMSREWIRGYAAAVGAPKPMRVPAWLGRLAAGAVAEMMLSQRGASNAKARRDLGWVPKHSTWREGFKL
jgi:nucleoside-diphosphate-sugar epimerase